MILIFKSEQQTNKQTNKQTNMTNDKKLKQACLSLKNWEVPARVREGGKKTFD